jgi:hypothetical protein
MNPAQLTQYLQMHQYQAEDVKTRIEQEQKDRETSAQETRAQAEMMKAEAGRQPTEASMAYKAAGGDVQSQQALKQLAATRLAGRPVTNIMTQNDAKDIADAIENGDQPPTLQGLYRNAGPVRAELARRGFPLAQATMDWEATKKFISSLNSTQQVRLRQNIDTASDSLNKLEGLYNEWQKLGPASGFKVLNHGALVAMKNLPGRPGAVAQALDAQIADLTSELGSVYMGGNSPTDHALALAKQNFSSDWNKDTFEEGLKQARANIKIRQNSIIHAQAAGTSGNFQYGAQLPAEAPAPAAATAPKATHRYNPATGKIEALP